MDYSRRNFIKGLAGLAALAVAPKTLVALAKTDRDRLLEQMVSNGIVDGMTFVFDDPRPVLLDGISNLIVRNCTFIWNVQPETCTLKLMQNCHDLAIVGCNFISPQPTQGLYIPL